MKKFYVLTLTLLFASFVPAFAASPYFFKGYVYVNGALAPNGTIVEAYVSGASSAAGAAIVGQGQLSDTRPGWYTISFEANSGNTVAFRVNNLSLNSANGTNTSSQTISAIVTENFNLSANTSANGASCLYAGGCTSGFCSSNYCCDTACTASGYSCSVSGSVGTCTATSSGSSGSSGGGGGGGGGGAVSTTSETVTLPSVGAGSTATASISSSVSANIGIEKIEFTPITTASNVQITVKETTAASAGVTAAISSSEGAVYKYLEITKTNIQDTGISSAKISFKVPKSWVSANNIDKNTITLNRFVNNAWSKLSTTISNEDSTYVYFSATSPGFSIFAITGGKVAAQPAPAPAPQPQQPVCGNGVCETGETTSNCAVDCPAPQPEQPQQPGQPAPEQPGQPTGGMNYIYLGVLIVLIIIAVGYFVMKLSKRVH